MKPDIGKCKNLLDSGFSLLTVGVDKIPNFPWKKYQTEPPKKDEFEKNYNYSGGLFKKGGEEIEPTTGVGIITGYDNLEVIDIDLKVFKTLKEQTDFWKEYINFLSDNIIDFKDKFVIYKTINGGYHILYKCQKVGGNVKLAKLKGHNEAIIETRGVGGYVFIYEKQESKKSYFELQEISEAEREVIFGVSKFYNYIEEVDKIIPDEIRQNEYDGGKVSVWDDYNAKTNIFDVIDGEFDIVKTLSDKYIIRRNGATSPHSGYVYKDSGCMYLFSTGTIYPNEKLISPFSAYTIKFHNNNYSNSAKELYKKGFGSRIVKQVEALQSPAPKLKDVGFPVDIFPNEIQNYILECNRTLDHSIDYMGCSFLWVLSVIIGNSIKIKVKNGWLEPATVWFVVVGKAGIGKTPSINSIVKPLERENNREIKKYAKEQEKYHEYRELEKNEKQNSEKVKRPIKTQFIADDITLEALVEMHSENKNAVAVFKDELAGWIKDMNKYRTGSDLEFWLSSWSAKSVSHNRKTAKSSFIESPCISVIGGIQPGVFDSFYTEENKDNGFIDRMLLCYPDLMVDEWNDDEMDIDMLTYYSDYIIGFFRSVKDSIVRLNTEDDIDPHISEMTPEAKMQWKRIFNKITAMQNDETENEYMKSMLPKQKSYIPRFALIINTLNSYHHQKTDISTITEESILAAERLSDYFIYMAKKIKVDSAESKLIKKTIAVSKSDKKETVQAIYEANPNVNKTKLADQFGVSRVTINEWIKSVK